MLLIACPWCGLRAESEFICAGEAQPPRPRDPNTLSDDEWANVVVMRENRRGLHAERWWHARGCGSWLLVERDTLTHRIASVSSLGGDDA